MTYLYSIVPSQEDFRLDVAGLDGQRVRAVVCKDLAAVVGGSPLEDYCGIDRQQAVRYLLAHQQVVEAVQRDRAVLPVKFGTVVPNEHTVASLLVQGGNIFREAIDGLAGQVQMEVVVLWDLQEVLQELSEDRAVVRLKSKAATQESVDDRIAVGKAVYDLLEQRRLALRGSVVAALQDLARDLVINPNMDDKMVANLALLVDRDKHEVLDERLHALDEEHGGLLTFRRIGPLPPYTFATVEVQVPAFDEVDKARRLLELGERHSCGEIRQAYHRLAVRVHPDIRPEDPQADSLVSELAGAYRLLVAYAAGSGNGDSTVCCFDRRTVEGTLMIALRRQESQA